MGADLPEGDTLERLEQEERRLSTRRARLHDRIDFVRANGNADGLPATPEQLEALEEQERALSRERSALHARIGELRRAADRGAHPEDATPS
jgi:chromosome segregation ATPase